MDIPVSADGITPEWMTAALSENEPGLKVDSVEIVDVVAGACTKVRLALRTNRNDFPSTVMMKAPFERHSDTMMMMHRNEYHAYHDLVPTWDIPTAKCHYAGLTDDGRALVILEDLCLRDVKFLSLQHPISFDLAKKFLAHLAKMHARWWNSPEIEEQFPWLGHASSENMAFYLDLLMNPETFARYENAPRGAAMPRLLLNPELINQAHARMLELQSGLACTINHGDMHLGNLYTDAQGEPGFLDYQPVVGPWSIDVSYFMIAGLDLLDRRRWQGALLQHYLDCLADNGITPPGFDEAWLAYRRYVPWGLLIWMLNSSNFQTETNNTAAATRFAMAMIDLDTFGALGIQVT